MGGQRTVLVIGLFLGFSGLCGIAMAVRVMPTIDAVEVTPSLVVLGAPTQVTVTAEITSPNVLSRTVNVQRRGSDGQWVVLGPMQKTGATIWAFTQAINEPTMDMLRLRVSAAFRGHLRRVVSSTLRIGVGEKVVVGEEKQINGPAGIQVVVGATALTTDALVAIESIAPEEVDANPGSLPVVMAFDLMMEPLASFIGSLQLLREPLQLSVPAPVGTLSDAKFYVALQVRAETESPDESLSPQLLAVDTAAVEGDRIVSQGTALAGFAGTGRFVLIQEIGSGFVEGRVMARGASRPGAYVSNDTNSLMFLTSEVGEYKLPISGTDFTLTIFDPATCGLGLDAASLPGPDATLTLPDLELQIVQTDPVYNPLTRYGLFNGSFERAGNTDCWLRLPFGGENRDKIMTLEPGGTPDLVTFNPPFPFTEDALGRGEIRPVDGEQSTMFVMAVGPCPSGESCSQEDTHVDVTLWVPPGSTHLRLDWNHGCFCEVPANTPTPDFGQYNDQMEIQITSTPDGSPVDTTTYTFSPLTTEGDDGNWRLEEIPIAAYVGQQVVLHFSGMNQSDNTVPTGFAIDNVHFDTVWLDVKIVRSPDGTQGSTMTPAQVRANVHEANDVLTQAGISLRVRSIQTVETTDPAWLDPVVAANVPSAGKSYLCDDGSPAVSAHQAAVLTATGFALELEACPSALETVVEQARSSLPTDVNVYYVGNLQERILGGAPHPIFGVAIGNDDYHVASALGDRGILIGNVVGEPAIFREILAHELGHLLLPFRIAGSSVEHGVSPDKETLNIMRPRECITSEVGGSAPPCFSRVYFNEQQIEEIRVGPPGANYDNLGLNFRDPATP